MQQKVLVTRPIFPDVIARLREYFDVEVNEGARFTPDQLHAALAGKDGVLVAGGEKIDEAIVGGLTGLKAVCVTAAGYNNVNVGDCTRAGIIVTNSPGPADETVADYTWGLMIATARRLVESDKWLREGSWKGSAAGRWFGVNLCDKTLGIIGMGRIGQAIARRGIGFRMRTLYYNRRKLDAAIELECKAQYADKERLLRESDFIVLALPLSKENHHTIAGAELALIKSSAMLFNIARGGLIDEPALIEALQQGRLAAAGLDVFEGEPVVNPAFTAMPNVVLTPHIAGGTYDTQHGLADLGASNLIAALGYGPTPGKPSGIVNPEVVRLKK